MMPNYTQVDLAILEKSYAKKKLSSVLVTLIVVLSLIVMSLIGYLLYKQL